MGGGYEGSQESTERGKRKKKVVLLMKSDQFPLKTVHSFKK